MRCMCCTHFQIFHGPHGCTAGPSSSDPCKCPGYEAPLGEGREAPSQAAVDDLVRAHADRGSKVNVHDIVPRETGGREAPPSRTDLLAAARESARNLACRNHGDDATRGDVARGVAAGYVTIIELVTEFALELSANVRPFAAAPSDPDAATVEACARAACEAHPSDPEWAISTEGEREMWRKVARTVLAAARGGK